MIETHGLTHISLARSRSTTVSGVLFAGLWGSRVLPRRNTNSSGKARAHSMCWHSSACRPGLGPVRSAAFSTSGFDSRSRKTFHSRSPRFGERAERFFAKASFLLAIRSPTSQTRTATKSKSGLNSVIGRGTVHRRWAAGRTGRTSPRRRSPWRPAGSQPRRCARACRPR